MGRSGRSAPSSAKPAAAPAKPAAPAPVPAKPVAAAPPAPAKPAAAPAPTPAPAPTAQAQQPQVTNVYIQQQSGGMGGMGGGGGGFMSTMAGAAVGSVVGHGISNMLFGRDRPPAEPAQAQAVAQQYGDGACGPHIKGYSKCMEANPDNSANCKWAWDHFMQCQEQQPKA